MKITTYIVAFFFALLLLTANSEVSVEAEAASMSVCGEGTFKSFMSMTKLRKNSTQYHLLSTQTTDKDNLRITNDGYYAVAMGSYYGQLGDKFIVTFANGVSTKVVKMDEKANAHTQANCYGKTMASDGSIIEPITSVGRGERSQATNKEKYDLLFLHGNAGQAYPHLFAGREKIIKIEKITKEVIIESEKPKKIDETPSTNQETSTSGEVSSNIELADPVFSKGSQDMYIYIPNETYDKLVFFDTEFSKLDLVQASFLTLERIDENDHFFLTSSLNVFVNTKVTPQFEAYTGIKQGFLGNEGLSKDKAKDVIQDYIDEYNIDESDCLIIGHGLNQDIEVLERFGCSLLKSHYYDTHHEGKILTGRTSKLKMSDLLLDAGYFQGNAHDAYQDARNLIPVYSYLKRLEEEGR